MRRRALASILVLMLMASVAGAQGLKLGVGAFGGGNIPIAQKDQSPGTVFGFMGRIKIGSFIVAEPNVTFGKWGEPDPIDGFDLGIEGSKITSYGIDATIGGVPGAVGFKPFGLVGAGIYSIKNDDTGYDESKLGFSFGFGANIGLAPAFDLNARARAVVAPQEEGSKKAVYITGGATYYFNLGS